MAVGNSIIVCPKAKPNAMKPPAAYAEQISKVWLQNYTCKTEDQLRWRQPDELSPASFAIRSPLDSEHSSAPSSR